MSENMSLPSSNPDKRDPFILKDVNTNGCELPQSVSDAALIVNPCNNDEIIIFGGYYRGSIFVYNKVKNEVQQLDEDIPCNGSIAAVYAIPGSKKHSLIIFWIPNTIEHSYYTIFDAKTMSFGKHERKDDTHIDKVLLSIGATMHKYKNWLFIIGGHNWNNSEMFIYDIADECRFQYVGCIDLTVGNFNQRVLTYHGSIIQFADSKRIKFVVFGGLDTKSVSFPFNKSFGTIEIDLGILNKFYLIEYDEKNINNVNEKNDKMSIMDCAIDITTDAKEWQNHNCNINNGEFKNDKYPMVENSDENYNSNACLSYFSYHWYNSRYLIIIGGQLSPLEWTDCVDQLSSNQADRVNDPAYQYRVLNQIVCFDFLTKIWYCKQDNYNYRLEIGLMGHQTIMIKENDGLFLYLFGGCTSNSYSSSMQKYCWKLDLIKGIDWTIERIVWIAFFKNENNAKCILAKIPKDVVNLVLSFIKRRFLFDTR